ncbi:MAG: hypothetical protein F6K19_43135 [Cyanothece sp. SIO1E1]|nr:hypothetical protein [Cyanothece sp. SIO1E1]
MGDRPTHLRAIDGLVAAYTSQGEFAQALTQLEARRSLTQGQANANEQLATSRAFAEFYEKTGNLTVARDFYRQSLDLARQLQDVEAERSLRNQLLNLEAAIATQ